MADYFFLPKLLEEIEAECDLTSVVSNRKRSTDAFVPHQVALYRQRLDEVQWSLVEMIDLRSTLARTVSTIDYDLKPGELLVGVPLAPDFEVEKSTGVLPAPYSRRNDAVPIEERVALRLVFRGARSSYQGDYPFALSQRRDGTVVSLGSLILDQPSSAQTYAVLINICAQELAEKPIFRFNMQDCETGEIVSSAEYRHNSVCTIAVPPAYNSGDREAFFFARETVAVPIFVTTSTGGSVPTLSVEHTHPPHEYFWQQHRGPGSALVKSRWMELARANA